VFVAITDAGCIPEPDWIEEGTRSLAADPMTVIAGRVAMPLGKRPSLAAMVDVIHHLDQYTYVESDGSAVTANILTSRTVFDRAGLFDERLRSSGDREWVVRAREHGAKLLYAHEATVVHKPRTRPCQLLRKSARVARGGSVARAQGSRIPGSRPMYMTISVFKPWNRVRGRQRLAENGARPGALRWLAVGFAQVALVQLPQAAVAAFWDVRLWRKARSQRKRSQMP
jgi:cellulose synthase/poly-beta-1,6-N-acetylglucosamine synthase-like glycosyltransferase